MTALFAIFDNDNELTFYLVKGYNYKKEGKKMSDIKSAEYQIIIDILLDLYQTKNLNDTVTVFLNQLRLVTPFSFATFSFFDLSNGLLKENAFIGVDTPEGYLEEYKNVYEKYDYTKDILRGIKSTAYKDTDILSDTQRMKNKFYTDYMVKMGVPYAGGLSLKKQDMFAEFTVFRSEVFGDLAERDIQILNIFKPHLENILFKFFDCSGTVETTKKSTFFSYMEQYDLTEREIEIAQLVINGYTNTEISDMLYISVSTVKKHIHNVYDKLGIKNRVGLINIIRDGDKN